VLTQVLTEDADNVGPIGLQQPINNIQQGRLAAARRTEKDGETSALDYKVEVLVDGERTFATRSGEKQGHVL
jgi:hypothetical protein